MGFDHSFGHLKVRGDRGDIGNQQYHLQSRLHVILGFLVFIVFISDDMTASTHQYKLRSAHLDNVELPVEIHMSQDRTFMKELLASQQDPSSGQVPDNDSSINESDCEALIASSDDDNDSNDKVVNRQKSGKKSDLTDSDSQSMSQQAINIKIHEQLQSLGKRLDAMERKSCKKYRHH